MKTYQVNVSSDGIGMKGLLLFTLAIIMQIIFFVLFDLVVFLIGFVMFMVGGLFGRSVQKHYDKSSSEDMVGVPLYQQYSIGIRECIAHIFPVFWFMARSFPYGFNRIAGFSCMHLTGGELPW